MVGEANSASGSIYLSVFLNTLILRRIKISKKAIICSEAQLIGRLACFISGYHGCVVAAILPVAVPR